MNKQKIIRVRENEDLSYYLDAYTETWTVLRVLDRTEEGWIHVLLERDEEASAVKQQWHENYLAVVDRIKF